MKGTWLYFASAMVLTATSTVHGGEIEMLSLKGIGPINLVVEDETLAGKSIWLTSEVVETAVSLRLRTNHVRVDQNALPCLCVTVNGVKNKAAIAWTVEVSLIQGVFLDASATRSAAKTWDESIVVITGLDKASAKAAVLDAIGDRVDSFCNDYLTANQGMAVTARR